ncbi:hypothetical protein EYF80_048865 [Liparis tanakae]|uniref:Interleukin-2 receptor subunit beta N-terminal domain-containing protein n=1 Tax=Liparis tanakae TaxID=230148 RepID=A0A4Z2FJ16_9TELE|nr:hypothetical protein EYF80_048865 [Liparis tanakae]
MAVMAVEIRASLSVLAVLCSVLAEHSHQGRRGLSCVNDFINNVSCTWQRSAAVAPGADCQVLCTKKAWDTRDFKVMKINVTESCELKRHHNATSGCSCVFRNEEFNPFSDLPCIRVECSGALMEQLTHYTPYHHTEKLSDHSGAGAQLPCWPADGGSSEGSQYQTRRHTSTLSTLNTEEI